MNRRLAPVAIALLPIVVGAVLLVAWPRTVRFSAGGISFDVPSGWTVHDRIPPSTGPGQLFALIGTMPWGPCEAIDINCHFRERFGRHEIEVQVGSSFLMGTDFCTFARERPDLEPRSDGVSVTETHYFRVDGWPAISTSYSLGAADYYLSDGWRAWKIGTSQGMYTIEARWRGPGDDEFIAALDQLAASIAVEPPVAGDTAMGDCGDPFPPLRSLAPGETASPAPVPSPTAPPEARVDCHGEATPLPSMLAGDPCPDAILAVELAVAPVRLPVERIVLEPGPFYCDMVWPGAQTTPPCFGAMVRPGQYMHGWVGFRGSDEVAAVMLGLDLPADVDAPDATRPPWHATLVTVEVPPPGWVMP